MVTVPITLMCLLLESCVIAGIRLKLLLVVAWQYLCVQSWSPSARLGKKQLLRIGAGELAASSVEGGSKTG
jgi:hypothetical protein